MEAPAGDGFEAFLQLEFPSTPASSDITSNSDHVSSHPPLPQSQSFPQTKFKVRQAPLSPMSSGPYETYRNFGKPLNFTSNVGYGVGKTRQRGTHRRAHSEIAFRLPDQLMVDQDPSLDNAESSGFSDEIGEDLLSAYMDMESSRDGFSCSSTSSGIGRTRSSLNDILADYDSIRNTQDAKEGMRNPAQVRPPRHHHSVSMDGSLSLTEEFLMSDVDFLETKKSMDMDQLAELSVTDPRRAKRILANRQSAARSKERKLKYIAELEHKIQKLQTEATSLSAQVSTLTRDSKGLSTQNSELKLRLQSMEQQAHLRDALNEALKEEVRWLKSASAQMVLGNGHGFAVDAHHQASTQPF